MSNYDDPLLFLQEYAMPIAANLEECSILHPGVQSKDEPTRRQCRQLKTGAHRDSVHHLVWTPGGRASLMIEDRFYRFEPGQIGLWPALTVHCEHSDNQKRTQLVWLLAADDRATFLSQGAACWGFEVPNPKVLSTRLEHMIYDTQSRDDYWMEHLRRELGNLLVDLVRAVRQTHPRELRSWHDSVCQAMENFIESHISDPNLSLTQVARHVRLCQSYASSLYGRQTGRPLWRFVQETRLRAAKKMLMDPKYNITEVSSRLGYTSPRHFRRLFKKMTNISPREYRQAHGA